MTDDEVPPSATAAMVPARTVEGGVIVRVSAAAELVAVIPIPRMNEMRRSRLTGSWRD